LIETFDYKNIEDADFFCRTYNIPFDPNLWIKMSNEFKQNVFKEYTSLYFDDEEEYDHINKDL
jgi:hypothetical protein